MDVLLSRSFMEDRELKEEILEKRYRVTLTDNERMRRAFVQGGLEETLEPAPSARISERKLDGRAEAYLIALACGAPPEEWTLRLLGDQRAALGDVDSVSSETVHQTLTKTTSSRG